MIEVQNVRIIDNRATTAHSGIAARYICEIRFVDPEQGTRITELGLEVWNYDKLLCFSIDCKDISVVLERAGRCITEVLCNG